MLKLSTLHKAMLPLLLLGLGGILCTSCTATDATDDGQPPRNQRPIAFQSLSSNMESAALAPHRASRTDEVGLETEADNFIVFANKYYPDATDATKTVAHRVMDFYEVKADTKDGTTEWYYDQVTNPKTLAAQNLRYWDYAATHYQFCAFAPYADRTKQATVVENANGVIEMKLPNIQTGYEYVKQNADGTTTTIQDANFFIPLYSKACKVNKDDYGKLVKMEFKHVFCKVRVGFCTTEDITSDAGIVTINNIRVKPTEGVLAKTAHAILTYDESNESKPIDLTIDSQTFVDSLQYKNVELVMPYGTKKDDVKMLSGTYYLLPSAHMGDQRKQFVFYANVNNVDYHVAVSKDFTAWEPNKVYTYIFKIQNKEDATNVIRLYAVEVEEWKAGGNAETKNDDDKNVTADW